MYKVTITKLILRTALLCIVLIASLPLSAGNDVSGLVYLKESTTETQIVVWLNGTPHVNHIPASDCFRISANNHYFALSARNNPESIRIFHIDGRLLTEVTWLKQWADPCNFDWATDTALDIFETEVNTSKYYTFDLSKLSTSGPYSQTLVTPTAPNLPGLMSSDPHSRFEPKGPLYVSSPTQDNYAYSRCVSGPVEDSACRGGESQVELYIASQQKNVVLELAEYVTEYFEIRNDFTWSPSGNHIAYATRTGHPEIKIYDLIMGRYWDTSLIYSKLYHFDHTQNIVWSPNEQLIAGWMQDIAGTPALGIYGHRFGTFSITSVPRSNATIFLYWSPDSQSVAYVNPSDNTLMRLNIDGTISTMDQGVSRIVGWNHF